MADLLRVPAHGVETVPWRQQMRGGTREDRMTRSIQATVPPRIADLDVRLSAPAEGESEAALIAVAHADAEAFGQSAALGRFLIRTESVASSKIERITASAEDYARAVAGNRGNASATSMVSATAALLGLVTEVGGGIRFSLDQLLSAHAALMRDDPAESEYAGRLRDVQNWIGGSNHSPRGALHVPPDPARVPELTDDLIAYLNRDDVPALIQAVVAHAQFESIHPFTDGNGRIGRALVAASLRRRGITRHTVIPLASGILARRDDYFDALGAYRAGDVGPLFALFVRSIRVAAIESRASIGRLKELPREWTVAVRPRAGSAVAALLPIFFDNPVLTADDVERHARAKPSSAYPAIDRLESAGVIREITGRKRDRVWMATDVTAELDDLDRRIQAAMR